MAVMVMVMVMVMVKASVMREEKDLQNVPRNKSDILLSHPTPPQTQDDTAPACPTGSWTEWWRTSNGCLCTRH